MFTLMRRAATRLTHRIYALPVLVLMPHSRCNCRCVMCDIWKANSDKREISVEELQRHIDDFVKLGVEHITLSGGEALMHSNLWRLCSLIKERGIRISLLSTGLTLQKSAPEVVNHVHDVIISLDGNPQIHNEIRNIPQAYERLHEGVSALRQIDPHYAVTGRCVIQKKNYKHFESILDTAHQLSLDKISFLPADVSSSAFNREEPWDAERVEEVSLSLSETDEFRTILEKCFVNRKVEFESGFVSESPKRLRRMIRYFNAINGIGGFESSACNAPWVSAVIESNGDIKPCFFHRPYGNLNEGFERVLNANKAIDFRRNLNIRKDVICQKCVCALKKGLLSSL